MYTLDGMRRRRRAHSADFKAKVDAVQVERMLNDLIVHLKRSNSMGNRDRQRKEPKKPKQPKKPTSAFEVS